MKAALLSAGRGIRWYLKQASGESKWDEYVAACAGAGSQPMSRRDFERRRADHKEHSPQSRCC